jgi:hypothetical protein
LLYFYNVINLPTFNFYIFNIIKRGKIKILFGKYTHYLIVLGIIYTAAGLVELFLCFKIFYTDFCVLHLIFKKELLR